MTMTPDSPINGLRTWGVDRGDDDGKTNRCGGVAKAATAEAAPPTVRIPIAHPG